MNIRHPVCVFFLFILLDLINSTTSQRQDYVFQSSSSQSFISSFLRILHVDRNFAIIGERNAYYNVSLKDLSVYQKYPWRPNSTLVDVCKSFYYHVEGNCVDAYVLAAVKRSSSSYWICASNARVPDCWTHQLTAQKWHVVNKTNTIPPLPLASQFQWDERITLTTKEKALYVIGQYHKDLSKWCPMIYRDNVYDTNGGIVVGGLKSSCDLKIFNLDFIHERATTFINMFESTNHVYFTFSEPAMEVWSRNEKVVFSRIARVCKNDRGRGTKFGSNADQYLFSTLFKARILCGNEKFNKSNHSVYHEFKGHFLQYLNELAAVSSPHVSSVRGTDGQQVILATFNSALGGLSNHSAICAYRFSEIEEFFNNHNEVVDVEACSGLYTANRPPARCYTEGEKITDKPAVTKYLLSEPIHPINNATLYLSTTNYRITNMQVDWQVNGGNNETYDVVFLSTDNGLIVKLLYFAENNEPPSYHVIQQLQVFQGDHIRDIRLMKDDNGDRYILANTREKLKKVAFDACERFGACNECRNEGRPYCSWNLSTESCGRFSGKDKDLDKPCPGPEKSSEKNVIQPLIITTVTVFAIGGLLVAAVMYRRSRKRKNKMGSTTLHNLSTEGTQNTEKMDRSASNFHNPLNAKNFKKVKVTKRKPAKTAPSETASVSVSHFTTGSVARRDSPTYSKKKVAGSSRGSNSALLLNYVMPSPTENLAPPVYKTVHYEKRKVASDPRLQTLLEPSITVARSHSFH